MATRKNVTRRTDRNRIERMLKEGYDLTQISAAVSVSEEHLAEVIKIMGLSVADSPADQFRAQIKAEIMAEMGMGQPVEKEPEPVQVETNLTPTPEQMDIEDDEAVAEPKPRRRKRSAA